MRGEVLAAAAVVGQGVDELPGVQEAGAQGLVHVQFAQGAFDFGCEKGRVHGAEKGWQGGV